MPDDDHDADWDEHASWIALLDDSDDSAPADAFTLVDRLGPAFAAHQRQAKGYIKHAYIQVLQHTRQTHDAIQNDVFPRSLQALALLDDAGLRFESTARRDMDAARAIADNTKCSLDALFSTLNDLVRQGDLLLHAFKTSTQEHVRRLRRCTDQMPLDAEQLMAGLDRRMKHLGAEDHAKAKENLLRGILEKY